MELEWINSSWENIRFPNKDYTCSIFLIVCVLTKLIMTETRLLRQYYFLRRVEIFRSLRVRELLKKQIPFILDVFSVDRMEFPDVRLWLKNSIVKTQKTNDTFLQEALNVNQLFFFMSWWISSRLLLFRRRELNDRRYSRETNRGVIKWRIRSSKENILTDSWCHRLLRHTPDDRNFSLNSD